MIQQFKKDFVEKAFKLLIQKFAPAVFTSVIFISIYFQEKIVKTWSITVLLQ